MCSFFLPIAVKASFGRAFLADADTVPVFIIQILIAIISNQRLYAVKCRL
jgi:hypothetical protein